MTLVLMSCKNDIELVSATKQKVIPGLKSVGSYSNYIFKVDVKSDTNIVIHKILIVEDGSVFNPQPRIKKEKTAAYIDKITEKGTYFIEGSLRKGKFSLDEKSNLDTSNDKAIIYYTLNESEKKVEIKSFIKKIKTRR